MLESFFVEIVGGVISTFLGFFLAMYLQRKTDKDNEARRITLIIRSVAEELSDISAPLKQYIDKKRALDRTILTPNLDALVNSGMIIELIDKDIYPYIIDAFSYIKRLNAESNTASTEEQLSFMNDIINCSDNVMFLTKKLKEGAR